MIAILSDIHGNYPALQAVMDEIGKKHPKTIISLGDIAGYYCYINECINLCKSVGIINIMGNHDYYLVSGNGCPRSNSANLCLKYQMETITEENRSWLESSLKLYDDDTLSLRHGGWNDPLDEYIYDFNFCLVGERKQKIFASGHTHRQNLVEKDGRVYFNPGSVGQPRDYDPRAAYALVYDNGDVELKRCEYPVEKTIEAMKSCGFQERISKCLRYGTKIGEIA